MAHKTLTTTKHNNKRKKFALKYLLLHGSAAQYGLNNLDTQQIFIKAIKMGFKKNIKVYKDY